MNGLRWNKYWKFKIELKNDLVLSDCNDIPIKSDLRIIEVWFLISIKWWNNFYFCVSIIDPWIVEDCLVWIFIINPCNTLVKHHFITELDIDNSKLSYSNYFCCYNCFILFRAHNNCFHLIQFLASLEIC